MCYPDGFCVFMNDSEYLLYINIYFCLVVKLLVMSFDSSCGFLFNPLHYYYHGGCQYVKGTKQT